MDNAQDLPEVELSIIERFICPHCDQAIYERIMVAGNDLFIQRQTVTCPTCQTSFEPAMQILDNAFHYAFQCEKCGQECMQTSPKPPKVVNCTYCLETPQHYFAVFNSHILKWWRVAKNLLWINLTK